MVISPLFNASRKAVSCYRINHCHINGNYWIGCTTHDIGTQLPASTTDSSYLACLVMPTIFADFLVITVNFLSHLNLPEYNDSRFPRLILNFHHLHITRLPSSLSILTWQWGKYAYSILTYEIGTHTASISQFHCFLGYWAKISFISFSHKVLFQKSCGLYFRINQKNHNKEKMINMISTWKIKTKL